MSDAGDGSPPSDRPGDRPEVGSVGEEAAKLLGALSDWARDTGGGAALGDALTGLAGHASEVLRDVDGKIDTGAPECAYCPVCRTVHVVRAMSPEVKAHLAAAGSSFLQAVAGAVAALPAKGQQGSPTGGIERIDLDGDGEL